MTFLIPDAGLGSLNAGLVRSKNAAEGVWAKLAGRGLDEQIALCLVAQRQIKAGFPSTGSKRGRNLGDLSPSPPPVLTDGKPHH